MILSSGWKVWNSAISACVILVFVFEILRVPFLFPPFLLLQSPAFFLHLVQSWIIFRTPGLFLVFLHFSLKKNPVVSEMSTTLQDLVSPKFSFLTCETFCFLWSQLFWLGFCAGNMNLICVVRYFFTAS